jgi:hypothetical protein
MAHLNAAAKAALKEARISQVGWARANFMRDGEWNGDVCGCPDDRCVGFHHDGPDDCGCLPALIADYGRWLRGEFPGSFDETASRAGH